MKPVTKAKSVGRGKTTAKRPVTAKKPKTAPKKSPPKKKIAVVPPGLAFGEFEALRKQMDLSLDELTARLGLSRATVAQRKAAGRLTSDESGKVVCFARLLGHAVHLFGDLEEARQWLKTPQRGSAWRGAARLRQNGDGRAGSREPAQPARPWQSLLSPRGSRPGSLERPSVLRRRVDLLMERKRGVERPIGRPQKFANCLPRTGA